MFFGVLSSVSVSILSLFKEFRDQRPVDLPLVSDSLLEYILLKLITSTGLGPLGITFTKDNYFHSLTVSFFVKNTSLFFMLGDAFFGTSGITSLAVLRNNIDI